MNAGVRLEIAGARAEIVFDTPARSVNTFGTAAIQDFERVLDTLESSHAVTGVRLVSAKPDNFLSGADLDELDRLESAEQASAWLARGQRALARLARLRVPSVAAIHGAALGGGLELALACTYRVASDDRATQLGLPEVQLGLCPALGGTWRLPARAGLAAGLELLLSGRRLSAAAAARAGLVDEVVPAALLAEAAERLLAERPRPRRGGGWGRRALAGNPLGRALVFRAARRQVRARGGDRLPAPAAILAAARAGAARGGGAAERIEAREFGALALSDASRALVALFRAGQAARPKSGGAARPLRLGVLGAGLMGAGIARVALRAGHTVRLHDTAPEALGRALASAARGGERGRRAAGAPETRARLARLTPALAARGFAACDLVIEAIVEELAAKRELLARVARELDGEAILASNTSTLPILELAVGLPNPERVLGLHFFSPVERMPLVEIVRHAASAERAIESARRFVASLGKTPIVVADGPGFYTSRILAPYLAEGARLAAGGLAIPEVDAAGRAAGFPVGPLTLVDEIGLDVAARAAATLAAAFPDRMPPADGFRRLVDAGRRGRKGGLGFYDYRAPVKRADPEAVRALAGLPASPPCDRREAAERLLFAMVAEAVRCLEQGVLASPGDGDLGAVLGLGFPPDLGGPFRWLDRLGAGVAVERLERLRAATGAALYEPPALLRRHAERGGRFHGAGAPR